MEDESWRGFMRIIKQFNMPKPVAKYVDEKIGKLAIAWPDVQIGVALDGDDMKAFQKKGWTVHRMSNQQLSGIGEFLKVIDSLFFDHQLNKSKNKTKTNISGMEQILLRALLERGVPMPERDTKFSSEDGDTNTVPDFVWQTYKGEEVKVIAELDGWRWHSGLDIEDDLAGFADLVNADPARQKQLVTRVKARGAKDAAKRRMLMAEGWVIPVVHDTEMDTPEAVGKAADNIKATLEYRLTEKLQRSQNTVSEPKPPSNTAEQQSTHQSDQDQSPQNVLQ